LLESESEIITVAELNLKSGQKARRAAAYAEGFGFIEHGLALLGPDSWQDDYDLTLALHDEAAELAYLTGDYDKLEKIEGRIHKNARSILDRARVYHIRIHADISLANYLAAIEIGIRALAELGIKIPREPTPEDHQRFQAAFSEALAGRSLEELVHLPAMTDRTALAAMEILAAGVHTAFVAAPSDEATAAVKMSNQLQKVALALLDNPNNACSKAKTLVVGAHIQPWNEPFINALDTVLKAYEAGLETGDLVFAALGIYNYANLGLAAGMNLGEFQRKVAGYNQGVKAIGQEVNYRRISIGLQTAQNFMTPGSTPHVLKGRHFDEDRWLPDAVATKDRSNLNYLFLEKLWLSYHFDCDDKLIEYAGEAEKYLDGVTAMINTALFRFYDSLSRLRLYDGFSENERAETLQRVASNQLRMRIWSENAPMNFQHKYDLVAAETARVTGNIGPAMENYE
jgi:predicted ATPase